MNDDQASCLVILAGGQSLRMGSDKAVIRFQEQRLIDRSIARFQHFGGSQYISANENYGTGLSHIPDNPQSPGGPVGAIFSISKYLLKHAPEISGFSTIPVDAPFASPDLISILSRSSSCAVASNNGQLQPTFAFWHCRVVDSVEQTHDIESKAPSLHWLARQCGAEIIEWSDKNSLANINTPGDLEAFQNNPYETP